VAHDVLVNVAQNWALVGLIGTLIVGLLAMVSAMHVSTRGTLSDVRGSMSDLRGAMADLRQTMADGFRSVDARLAAHEQVTNLRFDGIDRRLDGLDRDVQALSDHVFRDR
jgi:hypothetical protein